MKITTHQLYCLCNKYQWFTNGDNTQYSALFELAANGVSLEKLATIIWICSSKWNEQDILEILKKETDIK